MPGTRLTVAPACANSLRPGWTAAAPPCAATSTAATPGIVALVHHGGRLGMGVVTAHRDIAGIPGRFGWDGAFGTSWWVDPAEALVCVLMTQRRPDVLAIPPLTRDFATSVYELIE